MTENRARAEAGPGAPPRRRRGPKLSPGHPGPFSWRAEWCGAAVAVTFALLAVWHLAASERSWMLFYSGNSVLPALVRGSILAGEPQHWAFSAVIFVPELALYFAIAALGLGVKATFAVNAVINFVLLYGMFRMVGSVTRSRLQHSRRVAGAVLAFAVVVALSLLESSAKSDSLELTSLLATTTYYSATVLALVAGTGLTAAVIEGRSAHPRLQWTALAAVSTVSVLSNPLYVAWVVIPLTVVGVALAMVRVASWRAIVRGISALASATLGGFILRVPFADLIAQGPAYADPSRQLETFVYYLRLLVERLSSPAGVVSVGAVVFLVTLNLFVLVRSVRRKEIAVAIVAGMGCAAPVILVIGAIVLGVVGARYLQPIFFAPVLVLALLPGVAGLPGNAELPGNAALPRWARTCGAVAAITLILAGAGSSVLGLTRSVTMADPSIRCATDWITASHQTGAGRFWTVRGPKAYLADPRQLVQVDGRFNGYSWLTDRSDYDRTAVSFILTDSASPAPTVPPDAAGLPYSVIRCGRYTISDYHDAVLPIGPAGPIERH